MKAYCYITFPTTFSALHAESILKKTDLSFKMVPVPRFISSSCGIAIRCYNNDVEHIRNIFCAGSVKYQDFHADLT